MTQPMTLGDTVRQDKMSTSDFDVRRTLILFGDPSTRLKQEVKRDSPDLSRQPLSSGGQPILSDCP